MENENITSDHQPEARADMETIKQRVRDITKPKMTKLMWGEAKLRAESGESYEALSLEYPATEQTIRQRAYVERWLTPARIQKGVRGELTADDPDNAASQLWIKRKEEARETIHKGAKDALSRFFAMAPVPQSFGEAAIAKKMLDEAITPPEEQESKGNINLALLTTVGFTPRIQD